MRTTSVRVIKDCTLYGEKVKADTVVHKVDVQTADKLVARGLATKQLKVPKDGDKPK